jgi:hypothetical protein
MYIAVICRTQNLGVGVIHPAAITHPDKDLLIQKAIAKRTEMANRATTLVEYYAIYIGELTDIVSFPVSYELKKIQP